MADKPHLIVSDDAPSAAPPAIGMHYVCFGDIYQSVGTESVDDWVLLNGLGMFWSSWAGDVGAPVTYNVEHLDRVLVLSKNEGPVSPTTFVFPAYKNVRRGLKMSFYGGTEAAPLPVVLDLSAGGTHAAFSVMQFDGVTPAGGENGVLQLTFTQDIELTFREFDFNWDGDNTIGFAVVLDARLLPKYTDLPQA